MDANVEQLPVADRLWVWGDTYKRQIAIVASLLVIAGLIIYFIVWRREQKQANAGAAVSQVAVGDLINPNARTSEAQEYLKVAGEYPNSLAGARALLLAAGGLFTEGKYPEARAQFEKFVREYQGNPLMGQALLGVAACYDAEGKTDQAVTAYKDLVTRHPGESFIPQAKFSLAHLYETQNKAEQARDLYQEVERAAPFTSLGNEAGVRLEELVAKNPSLAPAPPAPTSAPANNLAPLLQKK
jgi:TolA-binding protein